MSTKFCTKCKKEVPTTEFHKGVEKDGLCCWCKKCRRKYAQQYYQNNRDLYSERGKIYYEENKERILIRNARYEKTGKGREVRKKAKRKYNQSEKGIIAHRKDEKRYRNSEKGKKTAKKGQRKYKQSSKGRAYRQKDYENNKLSLCISAQIRHSLNGNKNGRHWEDLVNYTLEQLKQYLEDLFQPGMMWDNYGKWHIDHKIPISSFNITSYKCEDFKKCWSLGNLQPLWAEDNLSKGSKMVWKKGE